jgi:hypothetical protein
MLRRYSMTLDFSQALVERPFFFTLQECADIENMHFCRPASAMVREGAH